MKKTIVKTFAYMTIFFNSTLYAATHTVNLVPGGEQYIYVTMTYLAPLNSNYFFWKFVPRCQRYTGTNLVNNVLTNQISSNEHGEIIIEPVGSEAPMIRFGEKQVVSVKMKVYSLGASVYDPEFGIYCDGRAIGPEGDISYSTADPLDGRMVGNTTRDTIKLNMPISPVINVYPNAVDLGECTSGQGELSGAFNIDAILTGGKSHISEVMRVKVEANPELPTGSTVRDDSGYSLTGFGVSYTGGSYKRSANVSIPCPVVPGRYNWSLAVIAEHL